MKHIQNEGPEIKTCNYRGCGVPFERPANMHNANWKQCTRCPKHRQMSGSHKQADKRLGYYEVKNETIDRFLRTPLTKR